MPVRALNPSVKSTRGSNRQRETRQKEEEEKKMETVGSDQATHCALHQSIDRMHKTIDKSSSSSSSSGKSGQVYTQAVGRDKKGKCINKYNTTGK